MKKEEKLHRLFGEIDDDLVADAAAKPIPLKVWLPRVTAAVAAVAMVVGVVLAHPWDSNKPQVKSKTVITTTPKTTSPANGGWDGDEPIGEVYPDTPIASAPAIHEPSNVAPPRPTQSLKGTTTTAEIGNPDIWYEQPWEELPLVQRYPDFERDGMQHRVMQTGIDASLVGEYLTDVELRGYHNGTQTVHTESGHLYRLKGINDAYAVALRYGDGTTYYPAINYKYSPATLGDLVADMNLRNTLLIDAAHVSINDEDGALHGYEYHGLTATALWELLMTDPTLPEMYHHDLMFPDSVLIEGSIPHLGYSRLHMGVSKNGYFFFQLEGHMVVFDVGEETYTKFIAYLQEHCRVIEKTTRAPLTGDTTDPHTGTTMTTPAQPPLTTRHSMKG